MAHQKNLTEKILMILGIVKHGIDMITKSYLSMFTFVLFAVILSIIYKKIMGKEANADIILLTSFIILLIAIFIIVYFINKKRIKDEEE